MPQVMTLYGLYCLLIVTVQGYELCVPESSQGGSKMNFSPLL